MEAALLEGVIKSLREQSMLTVQGGSIYREAAGAGVGLSDDHLALINEWTRNPVNREQVYTFPALAIDEQATRNYVRYTAASQRASVQRWVGIPFLYNEDSQWASLFDGSDHSLKASSQMGRIYKSELVKTPEGFIGTLVHVYTVKGLDEKIDSFINRIDAGLLREVSIHVMVPEGAKCNICKQMYPCGDHEMAHDYDGKTCTVDTVGAFVPLELSSVACPGSIAAHVMPDGDTSNYKVIALREALGGSRASLESKTVDHKAEACTDNECKEDACKERITSLAENAPAEHQAESCADEKCEDAACKEKRKQKTDEDEEDDEEQQQSHSPLFASTEACPACGRKENAAPEATTLKEAVTKKTEKIRSDFKERVAQIVSAAETKVSEANARATAAESKAAQFGTMFSEYAKSTAALAVERGTKEAAEVEAYAEELIGLGFEATKAIRETLEKTATQTPSREVRTERLRENAVDRAKRLNSTTGVVTTENGATSYVPPRLG